jgi:branched-chain amino acid transport system permease protein
MVAISQLNVEAANVFNIQWTAYMIFAVLIGGIGSIEGPIIGSIIFIVLQQTLSQYNAWYLVLLGSLAIVMAIWVRGGLWSFLTSKVPIHLFPVQYLWRNEEGATMRQGVSRLIFGPVKTAPPTLARSSPAGPPRPPRLPSQETPPPSRNEP